MIEKQKKDRKYKARVSFCSAYKTWICLTEYNELLSAAPLFSDFKRSR